MDRDSSALQPLSISLATNDFFCCTTTNGLCPPLPSYLPPPPTTSSSLSISYYSMPCYLSTSPPLLLYLIFIMLWSFSFTFTPALSRFACIFLLFLYMVFLYFHLFKAVSTLLTTMTPKVYPLLSLP